MGFGGILGQGISTPVSIPDGGTGATTALGARTNLEVGQTGNNTLTLTTSGNSAPQVGFTVQVVGEVQ